MPIYRKLMCNEETEELLKNPICFGLLAVIAYRAKRTNKFSAMNLEKGESLLGDHKNYGMTRQQYRTALKKLEKWEFLTIRTTSKGTVAKLINSRVWDINEEGEQPSIQPEANHQATIKQPSSNH